MSMSISTNTSPTINNLITNQNNTEVQNSNLSALEKVSSGLRINKAADDGSAISIADSLRTQANSLGQAVRNSNDTIGIVQIADKAMDEQIKILDTIKTKALQAAQDGQTTDSRAAFQEDIKRLIQESDNTAANTSYNGQKLLDGNYSNSLQNGDKNINISLDSTDSSNLGATRYQTYDFSNISNKSQSLSLVFDKSDGTSITIESVGITSGVDDDPEFISAGSAGQGIGVLAETINKNSDSTGVRASYNVTLTATEALQSGDIKGLKINGVTIGDFSLNTEKFESLDNDMLQSVINERKDMTGVEASIESGRLSLHSLDGRAIGIETDSGSDILGIENQTYVGRLTLMSQGEEEINVRVSDQSDLFDADNIMKLDPKASATLTLNDINKELTQDEAIAIGASANSVQDNDIKKGIESGASTLYGAMAMMDIADSAMAQLDKQRADLGAVQNQLTSTVNNISVAQVDAASSEFQIRDNDFAADSSNFSRMNILAQAGSYAMSQANGTQQSVMRLLQ